MQLSPIGREALEMREGCRLVAYRDSVGVWTIGCGITTASGLIKVVPGLRITEAQADDLNARAFEQYADEVRKLLKRPVTQEQFDALVSLTFNIGPAAFARSSVLRRLNAGDLAGAAEAILMWDRPAEIFPRRQAEHDQFLTPYAKALPKARRTDTAPIVAPAAPRPTAAPKPLVAMTDAGGKPPTATKPALAGGLISAPPPVPSQHAGVLARLRTWTASLFGRAAA